MLMSLCVLTVLISAADMNRYLPSRSTSTTTTVTLSDETVEAEIASHKFVFVAGVPHSGLCVIQALATDAIVI